MQRVEGATLCRGCFIVQVRVLHNVGSGTDVLGAAIIVATLEYLR